MLRYVFIVFLIGTLQGATLQSEEPIELETFKMVDIQGDSLLEIIYGSSAGCVHVLEKINGKYQEMWSSQLLKGAIISLVVADIDEDSRLEIIVGTSRGNLYVYGTRPIDKKYDNLHKPFESISGLLADDVDEDERMELVVYNNSYIYIYEGRSMFQEWQSDKGMGAEKGMSRMPCSEAASRCRIRRLRSSVRGSVSRRYCFGRRLTACGSTRPGRSGFTTSRRGAPAAFCTGARALSVRARNDRSASTKLIRRGSTRCTHPAFTISIRTRLYASAYTISSFSTPSAVLQRSVSIPIVCFNERRCVSISHRRPYSDMISAAGYRS